MASSDEPFGDAELARAELLPHGLQSQGLSSGRIAAMWAALGCVPVVLTHGVASHGAAAEIVAVVIGVGIAVLIAVGLGRTTFRLGTGSVPQTRATFGGRGATVVLWWRAAVGVVVAAAFLSQQAIWVRRLMATLVGQLPDRARSGVPSFTDSLGAGAVLLAVVLVAVRVASSAPQRFTGAVRKLMVLCLALAVALMALAIVRGGLAVVPRALGVVPPWPQLLPHAVDVAAVSMPWVLGVNDWWRYRRGASLVGEGLRAVVVASVAAALLVVVYLVMAQASTVASGRVYGSLIPDAGGFAGIAGATVALVLVSMLAVCAVTLGGIYGPALALMGAWPYPRRWQDATRVVGVVVTLLTCAYSCRAMVPRPSVVMLGLGCTGLAGVLIASEVWRRGHAYVEELYLRRSVYGLAGGISLTGIIALLAASGVHPWMLRFVPVTHGASLRALLVTSPAWTMALTLVLGVVVYSLLSCVAWIVERVRFRS